MPPPHHHHHHHRHVLFLFVRLADMPLPLRARQTLHIHMHTHMQNAPTCVTPPVCPRSRYSISHVRASYSAIVPEYAPAATTFPPAARGLYAMQDTMPGRLSSGRPLTCVRTRLLSRPGRDTSNASRLLCCSRGAGSSFAGTLRVSMSCQMPTGTCAVPGVQALRKLTQMRVSMTCQTQAGSCVLPGVQPVR